MNAELTSSQPSQLVSRLTLENGMRVVHVQDTSTAMVALNVLYNTGARDEEPTLTGLAHLFEHNFFGGSENIADFDGELTAAGGESNAWTGNDFTNYYEVAPAHNAETLFHLESDRMLCPVLGPDVLAVQRNVVIEEFKQQCLNRPYGDLSHHLRTLVYGDVHPYSWPVIGKNFEQIQGMTDADLRAWYTSHYAPANAVLAVTGNITTEEAFRLARKWFGPIPARAVVPRTLPPVPDLGERREKTVSGNVPATSVTVAYLMDEYGTRGYWAADALTDLLSDGRASRFFRRLVMTGIFTEAEASITGSEHRGMLLLTGRLANEEMAPNEAVDMLISEARSVIAEGISDYDLQRLRNKRRAVTVMGCMDYLGMGQRLAMAEMHHEEPDTAVNTYLSLSADEIVDTARRIFDSHPAVLVYRPRG